MGVAVGYDRTQHHQQREHSMLKKTFFAWVGFCQVLSIMVLGVLVLLGMVIFYEQNYGVLPFEPVAQFLLAVDITALCIGAWVWLAKSWLGYSFTEALHIPAKGAFFGLCGIASLVVGHMLLQAFLKGESLSVLSENLMWGGAVVCMLLVFTAAKYEDLR